MRRGKFWGETNIPNNSYERTHPEPIDDEPTCHQPAICSGDGCWVCSIDFIEPTNPDDNPNADERPEPEYPRDFPNTHDRMEDMQ